MSSVHTCSACPKKFSCDLCNTCIEAANRSIVPTKLHHAGTPTNQNGKEIKWSLDGWKIEGYFSIVIGDVAETVVSPQEPNNVVDEPSAPYTPQVPTATAPTTSPMINALTEATITSVIGNIEEEVEANVPTRITRSRANRMNLSATFDGFVPAANPNAWRDWDLT